MSEAHQMCPRCESPLRPCKCETEDEYISPPGAVANSTLGTRKPLRSSSTLDRSSGLRGGGRLSRSSSKLKRRSLTERYGDDPIRYGVLFERVRDELREGACAGRKYLPGHRCGPGYAGASAHHLGDTDLDGLIPACGLLHDRLEQFPGEVDEELRAAGSPSLEDLGNLYVDRAAVDLDSRGELPEEVAHELERSVEDEDSES